MLGDGIDALRQAFRIFFREGRSQSSALDRIEADLGTIAEVVEFAVFIRESKIGIDPAHSTKRAAPQALSRQSDRADDPIHPSSFILQQVFRTGFAGC